MLKQNGFGNSIVFNLATDGAIPSDTFLINRKLLKGSKVPKWIVCGVAPRDFIDNLSSKENRTLIFKRLFDIQDLFSASSGFSIPLAEKLEAISEKCCFLYGERSGVKSTLANFFKSLLELSSLPHSAEACNVDKDWKTPPWTKTIDDYQKRYKTFNPTQFEKQKSYLKVFCEEATKKEIKILLVSMPLSHTNLELLPKGVYPAYH
jgi:hypothetical protein